MTINITFLKSCLKDPRPRTHAELAKIMDLIEGLEVTPSIDDFYDKLCYWILEVADKAYEDGRNSK